MCGLCYVIEFFFIFIFPHAREAVAIRWAVMDDRLPVIPTILHYV